MSLKTRVTTEVNILHPILLAPMAGVSGGALAAAVSNAGGLGVIGGGYGDKEWLQRELLAAGNALVGIGFISWALQKCPDLLNVALAREPKAIFLSFGEIRSFARQIKRAGVPLIAQIQTVAQARAAASEGAEFIVAQGTEAGGHGGTRSTFPLVPAVVDAVGNIPVIRGALVPRFRVRETPEWQTHAGALEAEMLKRGMFFQILDWSEGPPRERPMAWSHPPFYGPGAVLVRPDDGGVDHRVFVLWVIRQGLEKTLPNPARRPTRKALVDVLPIAEALRQIAPRSA